jgi:hypothetical protein
MEGALFYMTGLVLFCRGTARSPIEHYRTADAECRASPA